MHHSIPLGRLGPRGEQMAEAVQSCVHCGFCLPTCPTYLDLAEEMDSPRGRILLMKEVLEGKLAAEEAQVHIDRCLGCLACETACPSGVQYGELIGPYRALRRGQGQAGGNRLRRWLTAKTLPYPWRFRAAMRAGRVAKRLSPLVPQLLRPMIDLVPDRLPRAERLAPLTRCTGTRRARVALLTGCAQQVLAPEIGAAAVRVLVRNGVEVVVPERQGCCGALSWHVGDEASAARFARINLRAFPDDVDAVITTAAGCGSGIHDYPQVLRGDVEEERARRMASKTIDISAFLALLGIEPPPPLVERLRVAYHDACHLAHAQRVRAEPRELLRSIAGLELVEIAEGEICCGSAGTYNIDQPEIAARLGRRKAENVATCSPDLVALGNIGCAIQIRHHLQQLGIATDVLHTVEILDRAYRGILAPP